MTTNVMPRQDGTMWWPEMYMLSGGAPFSYNKAGHVLDAAGERVKLIGDTAAIFTELFTGRQFTERRLPSKQRAHAMMHDVHTLNGILTGSLRF